MRRVLKLGGLVERVQRLHLPKLEHGRGAAQRLRRVGARVSARGHLCAARDRVLLHRNARHRLTARTLRHPARLVRPLNAVPLRRQLVSGRAPDERKVVAQQCERLRRRGGRLGVLVVVVVQPTPLGVALAASGVARAQRRAHVLVRRVGTRLKQQAYGHRAARKGVERRQRVRQQIVVRAACGGGLRRAALSH